jgi:hypothetical protein
VSVVYVNVVGFHQAALREGAARLAQMSETLTSAVVSATAAERGVVDSFHGDQFVLTFNAAAACATHATRAPRCALRIAQRCHQLTTNGGPAVLGSPIDLLPSRSSFLFEQLSTSNQSGSAGVNGPSVFVITAGVATGPARCGTLGCNQSRRFSVVGAPAPQAAALERLVRHHPRQHLWRAPVGCVPTPPTAAFSTSYRVAVAQPQFEDLRAHFSFECVDVAILPTYTPPNTLASNLLARGSVVVDSASQPSIAVVPVYAVAQLLGELSAVEGREDEWMYAAQRHGSELAPDGAPVVADPSSAPSSGRDKLAPPSGGLALFSKRVSASGDDPSATRPSDTNTTTTPGQPLRHGPSSSAVQPLPLSEVNSVYVALAAFASACVAACAETGEGGGAPHASTSLVAAVSTDVLQDVSMNAWSSLLRQFQTHSKPSGGSGVAFGRVSPHGAVPPAQVEAFLTQMQQQLRANATGDGIQQPQNQLATSTTIAAPSNALTAIFATLPVPTRQRLVTTLLSAAPSHAQPGRSQVQVEALHAVFAAICATTVGMAES